MIIVSGMDNTGKTTLVKELEKIMGIGAIKSPGPITHELQKEWLVHHVTTEEHEGDLLFERFPVLEEHVYGKVLRNNPAFTYGDPYFRLLKKVNPLIVYTRPPNSNIFDFGEREQMKGVVGKAHELLMAYDELMFLMVSDGWRVIPYNYEINDPMEVAMAYEFHKNLKGGVILL